MLVLCSCGLQPPIWTSFWRSQVWRPKFHGTKGIDIRLVPSGRYLWYGIRLERFAFPWPLHQTKDFLHSLYQWCVLCVNCEVCESQICGFSYAVACWLHWLSCPVFRVKFTHYLKAGSSSIFWVLTYSATSAGLDSLILASHSHVVVLSFHRTQKNHPLVVLLCCARPFTMKRSSAF